MTLNVTKAPEVIIVGGGPGGSTCATRLVGHGRRVLLLEKAHHPRFHLGESLLPQSVAVFKELGIMETLLSRFMIKRGANFHEDSGKTSRYAFSEAYDTRFDHAFQVPRDEFDELLLRHAAARGADVREGWTVTRVRFEGTRAVGVEARDETGASHVLDADFVVDATGRDALLAHDGRSITKVSSLDKSALFSQFKNAWRDEGEREGDIQIVVFGAGWFWVIPFKDGRTSVGAVVSSDWMRANKHRGGAPALYAQAVSESRVMQRMLANAEQTLVPEATADFSYRVKDLAGDGWLAVGDSGGFIDPLFSTGAHIALRGGLEGADAIHAALTAGDVSRARFAEWETFVRRGAETFIGAVQAFYRGDLVPYLFAEKQHPYMRHAITSMLAGDVFDESARWVRDMRTRFPANA